MTLSNEAISERTKVAAEIRELVPNIDKETEEVLAEMYSASQLRGTDGDQPINYPGARISIAQGAQINRIIRQSEIISPWRSASPTVSPQYGSWMRCGLA